MFAGKTLGIGGPHRCLVNQQMIKEDKESEKSELWVYSGGKTQET